MQEVTRLAQPEELAFRAWAQKNGITDVDTPGSFYDYRGYWKAHGDVPVRFGVDHFPDTFKQHGHPTFSNESQYSAGPADGGRWASGTDYVPTGADFVWASSFILFQAAGIFDYLDGGRDYDYRNSLQSYKWHEQ